MFICEYDGFQPCLWWEPKQFLISPFVFVSHEYGSSVPSLNIPSMWTTQRLTLSAKSFIYIFHKINVDSKTIMEGYCILAWHIQKANAENIVWDLKDTKRGLTWPPNQSWRKTDSRTENGTLIILRRATLWWWRNNHFTFILVIFLQSRIHQCAILMIVMTE